MTRETRKTKTKSGKITKSGRTKSERKIRYAVVGLGDLAQVAVLPAFKNAPNSELVAIVSGDPGSFCCVANTQIPPLTGPAHSGFVAGV